MSGAISSHGGLTRRSFLKATGAVAGAAAVTGVATPTLQALAADYESGQKESEQERIFRGVCRPNCFAFCHLNVHVRDGKVVKTSRAPYNEKCYDRICQRGLSHVHRIYDPARLQYPMRRVEGTERGAGEWERVSWDEALDEIAGKIKSIQTEFGESAVAFLTASGNQSCAITSAYGRLSSLMNASSIGACLDMGSYYGMQAVAGLYISPLMGLQMWEGNEPTDAKNAKTIVVWGANITDAQVQNWHLVKEAMQGGTKLVVIDPVYTQIASKADRWIPIRPGSDTLLKYALMNVVLEKDAQDVAYLQQHTVAPFLVRSDTGMFVRRSDTGIAPVPTGVMNPTTGKEVMDDPYMVLSNGELVSVDETSAPDIEGSYELDIRPRRFRSLPKYRSMTFTSWPKSAWTPRCTTMKAMVPRRTTTAAIPRWRVLPFAPCWAIWASRELLTVRSGASIWGSIPRMLPLTVPARVLPFPAST